MFGQCRRRERPHRKKRKPAEELHHPKLQHHLRHSSNRTEDFLGAAQKACRQCFRLFECSQIFRWFFVRGPYRDDDGNQEHRRAYSERVEHRIRNLAGGSFVFRTQLRNNPRKVARHPGAYANNQRLQYETKIALVFRQLIRNERAERLHADVDGCVQQQTRQGRCNPQTRQFFRTGPQRLKNARHVTALQGKSKLDSEESEAHVPDLPKRKSFLFLWHKGSFSFRI